MLDQGRVSVNGALCKIASRRIKPGDQIEIAPRKRLPSHPAKLEILHEDDHILVIHKPCGLLSVATAHEREKTAFAYLRRYLKETQHRQDLFIIHRLDKFTSGVLVFAKSKSVQASLRKAFSRHEIERKYWAIVEGKVEKDQATICSRLRENRLLRMETAGDPNKGKLAVTHFRVLRRFPKFTSLEVSLETGRKNQIRVHLSEMGHPIVGDRAYGSKQDPLGRLGLHAFLLGFKHPVLGTPLLFQTDPPAEFTRFLPRNKRLP